MQRGISMKKNLADKPALFPLPVLMVKKIANQYNTDWSEHGVFKIPAIVRLYQIQTPLRSLLWIQRECLCSPWNSSKRTAGAMIMSPSSDRNQIRIPEKWRKSIWSSAASRQIWGRIRRIPSSKTCRRCRAASSSWPPSACRTGAEKSGGCPAFTPHLIRKSIDRYLTT